MCVTMPNDSAFNSSPNPPNSPFPIYGSVQPPGGTHIPPKIGGFRTVDDVMKKVKALQAEDVLTREQQAAVAKKFDELSKEVAPENRESLFGRVIEESDESLKKLEDKVLVAARRFLWGKPKQEEPKQEEPKQNQMERLKGFQNALIKGRALFLEKDEVRGLDLGGKTKEALFTSLEAKLKAGASDAIAHVLDGMKELSMLERGDFLTDLQEKYSNASSNASYDRFREQVAGAQPRNNLESSDKVLLRILREKVKAPTGEGSVTVPSSSASPSELPRKSKKGRDEVLKGLEGALRTPPQNGNEALDRLGGLVSHFEGVRLTKPLTTMGENLEGVKASLNAFAVIAVNQLKDPAMTPSQKLQLRNDWNEKLAAVQAAIAPAGKSEDTREVEKVFTDLFEGVDALMQAGFKEHIKEVAVAQQQAVASRVAVIAGTVGEILKHELAREASKAVKDRAVAARCEAYHERTYGLARDIFCQKGFKGAFTLNKLEASVHTWQMDAQAIGNAVKAHDPAAAPQSVLRLPPQLAAQKMAWTTSREEGAGIARDVFSKILVGGSRSGEEALLNELIQVESGAAQTCWTRAVQSMSAPPVEVEKAFNEAMQAPSLASARKMRVAVDETLAAKQAEAAALKAVRGGVISAVIERKGTFGIGSKYDLSEETRKQLATLQEQLKENQGMLASHERDLNLEQEGIVAEMSGILVSDRGLPTAAASLLMQFGERIATAELQIARLREMGDAFLKEEPSWRGASPSTQLLDVAIPKSKAETDAEEKLATASREIVAEAKKEAAAVEALTLELINVIAHTKLADDAKVDVFEGIGDKEMQALAAEFMKRESTANGPFAEELAEKALEFLKGKVKVQMAANFLKEAESKKALADGEAYQGKDPFPETLKMPLGDVIIAMRQELLNGVESDSLREYLTKQSKPLKYSSEQRRIDAEYTAGALKYAGEVLNAYVDQSERRWVSAMSRAVKSTSRPLPRISVDNSAV